jgi:hypothetical protein
VTVGSIISYPWLASYTTLNSKAPFTRSDSFQVGFNNLAHLGQTVVSLRPSSASLLCSDTLRTVRLIEGCAPTRKLQSVIHLTQNQLLYNPPTFLDGVSLVESLPVRCLFLNSKFATYMSACIGKLPTSFASWKFDTSHRQYLQC